MQLLTAHDVSAGALLGELVLMPAGCSERSCACNTTFRGLASGQPCATAKVAEVEVDLAALHEVVHAALVAAGHRGDAETVHAHAEEMADLGDWFALGDVVRRRPTAPDEVELVE